VQLFGAGRIRVNFLEADDLRTAVPDNLRDPRRIAASIRADAFMDIVGENSDRLHGWCA